METPLPRPKRPKIAQACDPCKARKVRCDGARPVCAACNRRSQQCVYQQATTLIGGESVAALRRRILQLEAVCRDHGIDPSSPTRSAPLRSATGEENTFAGASLRGGTDCQTLLESPASHRTLIATPSPTICDSNGVTAMGTIESDDAFANLSNSAQSFYGGSAVACFLQDACRTMGLLSSKRNTAPPSAVKGRASLGKRSWGSVDNFQLPTRALADHLVQCYIQRVYYLYPYFHLPAFECCYKNLWLPEYERIEIPDTFSGLGIGEKKHGNAESVVFHAALNAIFALGCHFSDMADSDKIEASDVFFNRSKAHIGLDLLEMNDLGVVQVLLLVAQALQGTSFPNRCWNATGIACRIAFAIGLHVDPGYAPEEKLDRTVRRRTWHGCITIDILVSMTFGRPNMVTQSSAPHTVEAMSRDQISHETTQERKLAFLEVSSRLSKIIEQILTHVYTPSAAPIPGGAPAASTKTAGSLDTILSIESKLDDFVGSLPPHLSWTLCEPLESSSPEDERIFHTQRNVLHARVVYSRLLLYRQQLIHVVAGAHTQRKTTTASHSSERSDPRTMNAVMQESFQRKCAQRCLQTAKEMIDLIHSASKTQETGSWWWNGLYMCTSGLIVIMSHGCSPLKDDIGSTEFESLWRKCRETLQSLTLLSKSARSSLELLSKIHIAVNSNSKKASTANAESVDRNVEATPEAIREDGITIEEGANIYNVFFGHDAYLNEPFFYTEDLLDNFMGDPTSTL